MSSPARVFLIVAVILGILLSYTEEQTLRPNADLPAYWASFHVLLEGGDPYSISQIQQQIDANSVDKFSAKQVWNPPILYIVLAPFLILPLTWLLWLWPAINICAVVISGWLWVEIYRERIKTSAAIAAMLVFAPCWMALRIGQISNIMLLYFSVAAFLLHTKRYRSSGLIFSLLTVKPHVVWLVWPYLAVRSWREKNSGIFIGGALGVLSLCALCVLIFPHAFTYWVESNPIPHSYLTSTIATPIRMLVQNLTGVFPLWPAIVIGGITFITAAIYCTNAREINDARILGTLSALSVLAAPYGYYSDYASILPAQIGVVVYAAQNKSRGKTILSLLMLFNLTVILLINEGILTSDHQMIFFPIGIFLLFRAALRN